MLFPFLYFKRSSLIGLDIQENDVFLIKISQLEKQKRVEAAALMPLPAGTICNGRIIKHDQLAAALSLLVQQTKTQGYTAAIALPGQYVINRQLNLPHFAEEEEYEAEILTHLSKYIPGMANDIYFDYCFLPQASEERAVQFVAAKADMVNEYIKVVNQSGLLVKIIDVDSYAMARAIRWAATLKDKIIGVLDVGSSYLRIMYLEDANIIFTHYVSIDLQSENALPMIAHHIMHTIQMCCATFRPIQVEHLYLIGNTDSLGDIYKYLAAASGLSIEIPDFLSCFTLSCDVSVRLFSDVALRSLISLGLALRDCPAW